MNRCQTYAVIVSFLALIICVNVANAQSRDKTKPTQLTSNEVSGTIGDNLADSYYYTFEAGPGEVTFTLTLETGRTGAMSVNQVWVELFNEEGRKIMYLPGLVARMPGSSKENTMQKVERITFSRRQRVMLSIFIHDENSPGGKYQLRLGGAVNANKVTSSVDSAFLDDFRIDYSKCLPKKGTLIVKMKDGSKKIIDLSEAETITVVP